MLVLFFKRLITAAGLFVFLFVLLLIGALLVGGAVIGARTAAENRNVKDTQSGYEAGREAGFKFGKRYGGIVFLGAFGISGVASLALSFSGVLPWCRRDLKPPPQA